MKFMFIVVSKVVRICGELELSEELLVNYMPCFWADKEKLFVSWCPNKGQVLHWG